jgi:hypothetical protein
MMRNALRSGIEWTQQSARLIGALTPDGFLCDWQELDNKIEAFRLFQYADSELQLPAERPPQIFSRIPVGATFRSIWVLEGAGHMAGLAASVNAHGLLMDANAAVLSETVMIPLHAGMGTAFAEKLLGGLSSNPSVPEINRIAGQFVDTCRANCRPGWEDACMEPIGLVVRCLYPKLLGSMSVAMEAISPQLRTLLWHGVGRGLYFAPTNFMPIPLNRKRMVKSVADEAGNAEDRRNVLAGLVWAMALVNLPHPAVVRSVAAACSELKIRNEFTNGLISALLAWRHMAPEDTRYIAMYTQRQASQSREAVLWNDWIATPIRHALDDVFAGLQRRNNIPALYTYRTQDELRRLSA